jgi:DNA uptake protein ComE-like DNA-binding protein
MVLKRWHRLKAQLHPLASRLEQDPTYRLSSYREVGVAAELGFVIDVNQATVDDWLRLPGFSIRQAQVLDQLRQNGVQFFCVEDVAAALGVPPAQLQPLSQVLLFCHYDSTDSMALQPLNLNLATPEQLCRLPKMSPQLAQAIVRDRKHRGQFRSVADFQQRLNLTPEDIQFFMYFVRT